MLDGRARLLGMALLICHSWGKWLLMEGLSGMWRTRALELMLRALKCARLPGAGHHGPAHARIQELTRVGSVASKSRNLFRPPPFLLDMGLGVKTLGCLSGIPDF